MSEIHAEAGDWEEAYNDLHELHVGQRAELAALREENARLRAAAELGLEHMRSLVTQSSDLRTTRFNEGEFLIEQALTGSPSGLAVVPVERLREIAAMLNETFLSVEQHSPLPDWLCQAIKSAEKEAACPGTDG
jgi:hypothetical protein